MNLLSISSHGGWTVALVGYSIVFIALVALVCVFLMIPKLLNFNLKAKLEKAGKKIKKTDNLDVDANVNAAIAMALYMHSNQYHDDESNIITIKKITKTYSPWSSKIYGVMNQPIRK